MENLEDRVLQFFDHKVVKLTMVIFLIAIMGRRRSPIRCGMKRTSASRFGSGLVRFVVDGAFPLDAVAAKE
ncbi:hypothetical protein M493_16045 [Geobacillus genomosp. 3]|uniref:Uncharacterized protein n=1 Tax=Geobacillus genomosp. 3 TaxID=1921421 RepID=S5ZSH2_GEOG3|nr:hypothetical protein [Geobacillus genomosp. 3]AGT33423.1 hypothetical protein M493_16045 [Geobacillus genomosp. 3]